MAQQNYKNITVNIDVSKDYKKLDHKKYWIIFWLFLLMLGITFINLSIGSSNKSIFEILTQGIADPNSQSALILTNLRLPHVLCSLIAGASLGLCGCMLQSALGNPLASPSTVGISQGASCGACIAIILFGGLSVITSNMFVILAAFVFALIPTILIFAISKLKSLNATSIILVGIAMSIFFSGVIAVVQYFADSSKIAEVVFWTFGSVYNVNPASLLIMFIVLFVVFVYAFINSINFNALECGDTTAHSVGINVKNSRLKHLIIAAICAACTTAFCGTINFIGLIAPHIMRRFIGSNYKYLIPASTICGACLLSLSDIISAVIIPGAILPIGAITSFIGAPIFIYVLIKKSKQI